MARNFKDLSEQEILALAISTEETDARIYADFAAGLKADYPGTAQIFKEMEAEEDEHRRDPAVVVAAIRDRGYRPGRTHSDEGAVNISPVASQNPADAPWL